MSELTLASPGRLGELGQPRQIGIKRRIKKREFVSLRFSEPFQQLIRTVAERGRRVRPVGLADCLTSRLTLRFDLALRSPIWSSPGGLPRTAQTMRPYVIPDAEIGMAYWQTIRTGTAAKGSIFDDDYCHQEFSSQDDGREGVSYMLCCVFAKSLSNAFHHEEETSRRAFGGTDTIHELAALAVHELAALTVHELAALTVHELAALAVHELAALRKRIIVEEEKKLHISEAPGSILCGGNSGGKATKLFLGSHTPKPNRCSVTA
ncbi:unnamed protein product [Cyprideis torosa]|uniref:Uncharacterized protein n=1 Tax=Cyprideis torosa TaxID=163714 RepID=A0A7R8ZK80_9CRUS|nr:unnamed protein product [Cyprideis torosa]CAG0881189.1 unnamed protein product [Cyprideis torosa]